MGVCCVQRVNKAEQKKKLYQIETGMLVDAVYPCLDAGDSAGSVVASASPSWEWSSGGALCLSYSLSAGRDGEEQEGERKEQRDEQKQG